MKKKYLPGLLLVILFAVFMIFYGGYYLINPDIRGEEILRQHGIPAPAVIAHRGASIKAPESTIPAYEKARETGADYLEADVQRTSDGELIIFHDETLTRTSNVEEVYPDRVQEEVGEFTYEELKELDFGSWFNEKFPDYAREEYVGLEIITLQDLIHIAQEGRHTPGLIIESKHPEKYPGIEKDIVKVLKKENWLNNEDIDDYPELEDSAQEEFASTIFFSFSPDSLEEFKKLSPEITRLLLLSDNMISRRSWSSWLDNTEGLADGLGIKGFMSWPWHKAEAHEKEKFVFPYTINELWQFKILGQFHSSGYITDNPELVLTFLERLPEIQDIPYLTDNGEE